MLSEAAAAKDYWRTHHLQGASVPREGHEHRWRLAEFIAHHEPVSVLEFGCASGRNLAVLREVLGPDAELIGVDMNETTLSRAWAAHPDMEFVLGDEAALERWPDGRFDVVFTSSVLDHIPDPLWRHVYSQLVRLAKKAVVLHEPVLPDKDRDYGWVECDCAALDIKATPFTYLHAYPTNDPKLRYVGPLQIEQTPDYTYFGSLYGILAREK